MTKIFKYTLTIGENKFAFPLNSKVLTVQTQCGVPCIWVLHPDLNQPTEQVCFDIIPTGLECEVDAKNYVGTFQLDGGVLVFHVFKK